MAYKRKNTPKGRPKLLKNKIKEEMTKEIAKAEKKLKPRGNSTKKRRPQHEAESIMKVEGHLVSKGRVYGSRNEIQRAIDVALDTNSMPIFNKVLEMALEGNEQSAHLLFKKIHPHSLKSFITLPEHNLVTLKDVSDASNAAMKLVATGDLALEDAKTIYDVLETRARLIQSESIEPKMEELIKLTGMNKR